ncbi:MAG: ATP-binding protein [Candidatus Promineifilaceae bacterium]|nr:ATP-binding protein [Candidatus Promineifilaceae bacterium]
MGRKASLTVPGRYSQIQRLCNFVAEGAQQAGFDEDEIFRVQLACDEACTNIIEHTYQGEDQGMITVNWRIETERFVIKIEDSGERFDPTDIPPPPPVPPPVDPVDDDFDIQVGGLGVFFMRQLMDAVTFSYEEGEGNVLTMIKQRPAGPSQ